ncbi:hypothetical protein PYCC9005_002954 [Savitreella phatthalungensis]
MSYNTVQVAAIIVTVVLFCFSATVVGLRIFDRRWRRVGLRFDDWAVLATLFVTLCYSITVFVYAAKYNLGVNRPIRPSEYRNYAINAYVNRLCYATAFDWAKCCIVLFYIRIADRHSRPLYWSILVGILAFCFFKWVLHFLILAIPCVPVSYSWNRLQPGAHGQCIAQATQAVVINVFTFITEGLIVLAPLPMLWMAGLSRRQKIVLAGMFSLALLIIVASGLKLRAVIRGSRGEQAYQLGIAAIWTSVETNSALFVAGALPLKSLVHMSFRRFRRRFSGQTDATDSLESGASGMPGMPSSSSTSKTGYDSKTNLGVWPEQENTALDNIPSNDPNAIIPPAARKASLAAQSADPASRNGSTGSDTVVEKAALEAEQQKQQQLGMYQHDISPRSSVSRERD